MDTQVGPANLHFTLRDLVTVVMVAAAVVGLYYALGARITGLIYATKEQTTVIEQQNKTIIELRDRLAAAESQLRSQDRSLNELTITLRVMKVIK